LTLTASGNEGGLTGNLVTN